MSQRKKTRKEINLLILTTSLKLELNSEEEAVLRAEMEKYIACVNSIVSLHLSGTSIQKFSSKDVVAELPSAVKKSGDSGCKIGFATVRKEAVEGGAQTCVVRGTRENAEAPDP